MTLRPFHLAFPVHDLQQAREFYGTVMGCEEGRCSDRWVDFNFFGHQAVVHLVEEHGQDAGADAGSNPVDGHGVPVPHFGIVMTMPDWQALADRLRAHDVKFAMKPTVRFKGEIGEQAAMFFRDPSGNALEMKAFADDAMIFAN